jgi:hypothetical protein
LGEHLRKVYNLAVWLWITILFLISFQNCGVNRESMDPSVVSPLSIQSLDEQLRSAKSGSELNLVWYDNDHFNRNTPFGWADGRPDNGGWFPMSPTPDIALPSDDHNIYRTLDPVLGLYDSRDPQVIRQHIYWMKAMGTHGVVIDWTNIQCAEMSDPGLVDYAREVIKATREFMRLASEVGQFGVTISYRVERDNGPDFLEEVNRCTTDLIYSLYQQYPNQALHVGGSGKPLLIAFSNFDERWANGPIWNDDRFEVRYMNGYFRLRNYIPRFGQDGQWEAFANNLPYWSFIENDRRGENGSYVKLFTPRQNAAYGEDAEFASVWVSMPIEGAKWDEWNHVENGRNTFQRQLDATRALNPDVILLNRFNYAYARGSEPQEGVNRGTMQMFEPTVEFGYSVFDMVQRELADFRGYARPQPNILNISLQGSGRITVELSGVPTRLELVDLDNSNSSQLVPVWSENMPVQVPGDYSRPAIRAINAYGSSQLFLANQSGTETAGTGEGLIVGASLRLDNGRCLDLAAQNAKTVQGWDCFDTANQKWDFIGFGGQVEVKNSQFQVCLTAAQSIKGASVFGASCVGSTLQKFDVQWHSESQLSLKLAGTDLCLDRPTHLSGANGHLMQLYTCLGTANQKFTVNGASSPVVEPEPPTESSDVMNVGLIFDNGRCLDNATDGPERIQGWDCFFTANQRWNIQSTPQGFEVKSVQFGSCLTAAEEANGAEISSKSCTGSDMQKFDTHWVSDSLLELRLKGTNLCVDRPTHVSSGNGHPLQLYTCFGNANQRVQVRTDF